MPPLLTLLALAALALAADPPPKAPDPAAPPKTEPTTEPTPDPTLEPAPTLPVLTFQAAATYPPAALAAGAEADVLLELDVDATGIVTAARMVEPAGQGFDEAAVQAARGFRFEPARDANGAPAAARIQYLYRFTVDRAVPPSVEGTVQDAVNNLPFPNVDVRVVGGDGSVAYAVTDVEGRFVVSGLPPGAWTVVSSPPGHLTAAVGVEVREGAVAQVALRAASAEAPDAEATGDTVTVQGRRASTEITERTLSQEEVRFLPGTGGDVVKVVQNLPGVARSPLGIGQLIIRGTAPEDSAYFLDGASIPIVFHFSGLSTILNGDLVGEVAYLPGNYGARYGRALGGLVDLRTKDELPEKSRGYVSLDLFQGTAYVEQKVGKSTALEFSLRRSWIDAVLTPVLADTGIALRAPRYWDAQARVLHQLPNGGIIDAVALFSDDRFAVVGENKNDVAIGLKTTFGKLRARWLPPMADGWDSQLTLMGGPESQSFGFNGVAEAAYERAIGFGLRQEFVRAPGTAKGGTSIGWRFGADLQGGRDDFLYNVVTFSPYEADTTWFFAPALYVEPTIRLGRVLLIPGMRGDALLHDFGYARVTVDPRLGAKVAVGPGSSRYQSIIKASVGRYSQFPTTRQLSPGGDGNTELTEAWSLQSSVGLVQELPLGLALEATGFYNLLNDLVVGREERFRFFTGPPPPGPFDTSAYSNAGSGRIYGAELLLRLEADKSLGLVSATFSRSVRIDGAGVEELFANDQPFVLNALASQELPKRWRVGVRGRLSAGDPYTPVVNRVHDLRFRNFIPVYGEQNSARLPATWSVDVRIDKEWTFEHWAFTTYLDLQNAFNVQNPEVMVWSADYSEETPINGLPIIPAFGVRGDW